MRLRLLFSPGVRRVSSLRPLSCRASRALAQILVPHHDALAVGAYDQQVLLGVAHGRALLVEGVEVLRRTDAVWEPAAAFHRFVVRRDQPDEDAPPPRRKVHGYGAPYALDGLDGEVDPIYGGRRRYSHSVQFTHPAN
jgi:hypothetical protein